MAKAAKTIKVKKKSYRPYTFDTNRASVYILRVLHDPAGIFTDGVAEFGKKEFIETLRMGIWVQGMTLQGSDGRRFRVAGHELKEIVNVPSPSRSSRRYGGKRLHPST